ncbi:recombination mediator RecR [Alphaproteobacteria bacterium]|nr:recombination mediator RecR [Alphaproteobacteria bacterium]
MSINSQEIKNLEYLLSRLPGVGPRSARRIVLNMLKNRDSIMLPLSKQISEVASKVKKCSVCSNLDIISPCNVCEDPKRDDKVVCIIEDASDLWALQKLDTFKGKFHVLGGLLSALDGIGPEDLRINQLIERITNNKVREVILALPLTIDGQTTVHYIHNKLKDTETLITQLAHGVPVGGELDYLDDGTITTALSSRRPL